MYGEAKRRPEAQGHKIADAIKKLIERAKGGRSVVRTLTDYDAVGIDIAAATITPTIRIGVDKDIVEWLHEHGHPELKAEDAEEEYTPSGTTIEIKDEYLIYSILSIWSKASKLGLNKQV